MTDPTPKRRGPKPGSKRDPDAAKPGPKAKLLDPVTLGSNRVERRQREWIDRNGWDALRALIDRAIREDSTERDVGEPAPSPFPALKHA